MKTIIFVLFLTVSSFKDSIIAGNLYLYEYYKIDLELPKSKEMLKNNALEPFLSEIRETMQKLDIWRLERNEIKFEEKQIRADKEKTEEISMIFANQMQERKEEILWIFKAMPEIMFKAKRLAQMINYHVAPVEFDADQAMRELNVMKKVMEASFSTLNSFLTEFNAKFEEYVEIRNNLSTEKKKEKLYRAFIHYLAENREESYNLEEAENKLKHSLALKSELEDKKAELDSELQNFSSKMNAINSAMLECHLSLLEFILRFIDGPFEALLGSEWRSISSLREHQLENRNWQWEAFKVFDSSLEYDIAVVNSLDVTRDDLIEILVRTHKSAKKKITQMTTQSIFRLSKCPDFDFKDLRDAIVTKIVKLPVDQSIFTLDALFIFTFFSKNIESFCESAYFVSNSMANASASKINKAISSKQKELLNLKKEKRANLWDSLLNQSENEELTAFWTLKKKIEERAIRILIVENEKKFEFTILNVFTFVVFFASIAATLFAVRKKEQKEEIERMNLTTSTLLLY